MNKKCYRCKQIKELEAFHKNKSTKDGHHSCCMVCRKVLTKMYVSLNRDKVKADKKASEQLRPKETKQNRNKASCKYRAENPLKAEARWKLREALKYKRLEKSSCTVCGAVPAEGHHSDYSKPLEVTWLCKPHHMAWHRVFATE